MFEDNDGAAEGSPHADRELGSADLGTLVSLLGALRTDVDDTERIDQIAALERIKGAAAAAQARVSVDFAESQLEDQEQRGVPARVRGRGIADQVALARRESSSKGSRHLGLARALITELPATMRHLEGGAVSEWRATLVCRETAAVPIEIRREVDDRLAPVLPDLSDSETVSQCRAIVYELDPDGAVARRDRAVEERRVSLRPVSDSMARLSCLVPLEQGVAAFAALDAHARRQRAQGDERTHGQVMADTAIERTTGQAAAADVPVEIQLVMTDETLLAGGSTPAQMLGHGPVPAAVAREMVAATSDDASAALATLRRIYRAPRSQDLVAMDSRRRHFDRGLRRLIAVRDQRCRIPWCDATIRHCDHTVPASEGGLTSADNGAGLCARANYVKEMPGWRSEVIGERGSWCRGHRVRTTTPTGHTYESASPPLLGHGIEVRSMSSPSRPAIRHSPDEPPG
jgi:hypothetical protein